jgi:CheY-like chemotaxis protein
MRSSLLWNNGCKTNRMIGVRTPIMRRVLVVDDDPTILQVAKTILARSGFTTLSADNGADALALLQTHDIDVLLTDLRMPGMSGGELIKEARRQRSDLPVCCMTAHIPLPTNLGVLIISKPFTPRALINAVRQVLKARPRRRALTASAGL